MVNPNSKRLSSIFGFAVKSASMKPESVSSSSSSPALETLKKLVSLAASSGLNLDLKTSGRTTATVSNMASGAVAPQSHNSSAIPITVDRKTIDNILDLPWHSNVSVASTYQRRKELSRERKQRWIFKNTQAKRFERLVRMCAQKLGTDATLELFGKLGRQTGIKEYNALIKLCIEKARESNDEDTSIDQMQKAFHLLTSMRQEGFPLEEQTYSPCLKYLIDMKMIQEFHFFSKFIKDEDPDSSSRLAYYEMFLWISVKNNEKVQELCNSVGYDSSGHSLTLADCLKTESYFLALCENDMKKEILQLLKVVDIAKVSSMENLRIVFSSFGRLALENYVEKFILAFKITGIQEEELSSFIFSYAKNVPKLAVEEVISLFKKLHKKLDVMPCSASFNNLIAHCCDYLQVHEALDLVDLMQQSGIKVSIETLQPILHASEQSFDLDLVRPIYSIMRKLELKPNREIIKSMINLFVKMKDFEGAFNLLGDMEEMNIMPTANMYNAIMAGYFREKNVGSGLMVLKQMQHADLKPDSKTFSYLISNCESEKDIMMYYRELQHAGVHVTKHVYMALINAYSRIGQFEKAKQVLMDEGIPAKYINEIKSALVAALASNGQIIDALNNYEEMKEAGIRLEPKAILSLIEYIQSEGELQKLLEILEELHDLSSWLDGCSRVILYCVRYKHLSSAVSLLKKLKERDVAVTYIVFDQIFSQISESEPTDIDSGLYILQAIKKELHLHPTRTSLDFLLSACAIVKDAHHAQLIWEEYQEAGLCINLLTYLRMYQVLLASGMRDSALKLLKKIPKDDPHVRYFIKACGETYDGSIAS